MQPEEGVWSLEDLDSIIRLDLRSAQCTMRLFTEGSLVILVGELVQGLFKVVVSHTHTSMYTHFATLVASYYDRITKEVVL